jgi:serine/threonine-protein kinase 24/25/MST4
MLASNKRLKDADQEYILLKDKVIGQGSFGRVYLGIQRKTGLQVAIKVIDLMTAEDEEDIKHEVSVLAELNSRNVVRYFGSFQQKDGTLWIVMEYCGAGSCLDILLYGVLKESHISILVRQVLTGLAYIHQLKKIHRDVKAGLHSYA